MKWVREHCHVIAHPRLLQAGVYGRDLWEWGIKYAGLYETDGELPMEAVISAPWGKGGKANIHVALKLVEVGLWERTERGFRMLRWAEMGNPTKAEIEESRKLEREGRADRRAKNKKGQKEELSGADSSECPGRTPGGVPYSISLSGSREGVQGEIGPPDWFIAAAGAAEMASGIPVGELPARWASYRASRGRKGWSKNHEDAVGWLVDVVRSERDKARLAPTGTEGGASARARRDLTGFKP